MKAKYSKETMKKYLVLIDELDYIDRSRVEKTRKMIHEGTYSIEPEKIAEKIVEEALKDMGAPPPRATS